MKDFAEAFVAAVLIVAIVIWCIHITMWAYSIR